MPPDFNRVMLIGRLTRDVEIRHTGGNTAVGNFGLAVGRKYKLQSGEAREETTFIDCEAWGRQAEVLAQYMSKGKPIFIEGRLKLDQWKDRDGNNRSQLRVVVENFQFIDSRGEGGGGGRSAGATHAASGPGGRQDYADEDVDSGSHSYDAGRIKEDEIPF